MGAQGDEKQCSRRNEEAEDNNVMENLETIQDFVAQIRKRYNIQNGNQFAKILKISRQAVKQYNDGRTKYFGEAVTYRIAELLKLNPAYVLLCRQAHKAKTKPVREVWLSQLAKVERYRD